MTRRSAPVLALALATTSLALAAPSLAAPPVRAAEPAAAPVTYALPNPWRTGGYLLATRHDLITVNGSGAAAARTRVDGPAAAPYRHPWLAPVLTLVGPPALLAATLAVHQLYAPLSFPNEAFITPLFGFGLGHVYAGDLPRAGWVTLGGPLAVSGIMLTGVGIELLLTPPSNTLGAKPGLGGFIIGGFVAYTAFYLWAMVDAYQTTARMNAENVARHAPN